MKFYGVMWWILPLVTVIMFGIFMFLMIVDDLDSVERIENECKQDCENLGLEYFKVHFESFRRSDCICIDEDGKPIVIW